MKTPRVVLVEPQNPANLGFVARAVANFGLDDLWQVGGCDWRNSEAEKTGCAALPILEKMRVVDSFSEAFDGCTHAIGFTARSGRHRPVIDLPQLSEVAQSWGEGVQPAFVFGREDRGLEHAEAEACSLLVQIPTSGLSSLNLSHAVAVSLYEWFREPESVQPTDTRAWADLLSRERATSSTQQLLKELNFPDAANELPGTLRRLASQPCETRDLRIWERVLRHIRHRLLD